MLPSRCSVCARWPSRPLCKPCLDRFARTRPRCRRCALPLPEGIGACGACIRAAPPLHAAFAAVDYGFPWSSLIAEFKFQDHPGAAGQLCEVMLRTPGLQKAIDDATAVVPMPLSAKRLASRGFNQAFELARRIAPACKVEPHLLLRLRDTAPQASLGRKARLANVRGAFAVEPRRAAEVRGARVLLVDDVMTSGASLFAAAEALLGAGAAAVSAAVIARTPE